MSDATKNHKHQQRMQHKQRIVREKMDQAQEERGIIILLSGNGKGKSSSAMGMVARALGHGMQVAVVQFIKGKIETGEQRFFADQPGVTWIQMATGYTWDTQNREADIAATEETWAQCETLLQNPDIDLVVLDEITIVLKYGYLQSARLMDALNQRPKHQHVVLTGRGATAEIIEIADTVSILEEKKHAFQAGIKAQAGIDL